MRACTAVGIAERSLPHMMAAKLVLTGAVPQGRPRLSQQDGDQGGRGQFKLSGHPLQNELERRRQFGQGPDGVGGREFRTSAAVGPRRFCIDNGRPRGVSAFDVSGVKVVHAYSVLGVVPQADRILL